MTEHNMAIPVVFVDSSQPVWLPVVFVFLSPFLIVFELAFVHVP